MKKIFSALIGLVILTSTAFSQKIPVEGWLGRGKAKESIEEFPKSFELYNLIGLTFAKIKKRKEAIQYYKKALNVNPYDQPAVELIKSETKKFLSKT